MNIVVTLKQVVDPNLPLSHIGVDAQGTQVVALYGAQPVINGYDLNALECALQLREAHGGRVTVITLGDSSCRASLKKALALGADAVALLDDPAWRGLDAAATGAVLAAAVRKVGLVDLVVSGRQASDTDGGQVLFWMAQALGLPAVSPVSQVEQGNAQDLTVHRLMEEGVQRVRVKLPAVLGLSSEANQPRSPSLKGTMAANRSLPPTWRATDLPTGDLAPKVVIRELAMAERSGSARLIEGATGADQGRALADALHAEGLL